MPPSSRKIKDPPPPTPLDPKEIRQHVRLLIRHLTPCRIVWVRRGTRPDIPDAVGKNLEGYSWVIVLT